MCNCSPPRFPDKKSFEASHFLNLRDPRYDVTVVDGAPRVTKTEGRFEDESRKIFSKAGRFVPLWWWVQRKHTFDHAPAPSEPIQRARAVTVTNKVRRPVDLGGFDGGPHGHTKITVDLLRASAHESIARILNAGRSPCSARFGGFGLRWSRCGSSWRACLSPDAHANRKRKPNARTLTRAALSTSALPYRRDSNREPLSPERFPSRTESPTMATRRYPCRSWFRRAERVSSRR